MRLTILFLFSFALVACNKPPTTPKKAGAAAPASQPAKAEGASADGVTRRGAKLMLTEEQDLAKVIVSPKDYEGKTIRVRGKVMRACTKKGCWMELRAEGVERGVRVRFKDYGFFVPKDCQGSEATVEGTVVMSTLDEPTAKHLEDEGATITRNAEGEAVEVGFVATGVELTRS